MDFDLVDDEGEGQGHLEGVEEGGDEVGDAEVADLALLEEGVEGGGDFVGVHEQVGTVELVDVDGVDVEAFEGFLAGPEDVFAGEVEAVRGTGGLIGAADTALGGHEMSV